MSRRTRPAWVADPALCACSDGCVWCYRPTLGDEAYSTRRDAERAERQRVNAEALAEVAAGTFPHPLGTFTTTTTWESS